MKSVPKISSVPQITRPSRTGRGSAVSVSERVTDLENPVAHFDRSLGADRYVRIRTRLEQPQERDIMSVIRAEQFGRTLTAVVENDRRPVAR